MGDIRRRDGCFAQLDEGLFVPVMHEPIDLVDGCFRFGGDCGFGGNGCGGCRIRIGSGGIGAAGGEEAKEREDKEGEESFHGQILSDKIWGDTATG